MEAGKLKMTRNIRGSAPNRAQSSIIRHELSSADILTRVATRPASGGQATLLLERVGRVGCALVDAGERISPAD